MIKIIFFGGLLTLLASLLLSAHTWHEPPSQMVNASLAHVKQLKGVCYVNNQVFTGTLFTLSPLGDTLSISAFDDGFAHGTWFQFYKRGYPKETRYFERGKKMGEYIGWWENGRLKFLAHFANDEFEGTRKEWNQNGLLIRSMNYQAGHEEGAQQAWYENGKVKSNYVVLSGRRYGLLGTKHCTNVSDSILSRF